MICPLKNSNRSVNSQKLTVYFGFIKNVGIKSAIGVATVQKNIPVR